MAREVHAAVRNPDVPMGGKLPCDSRQRDRCHRVVAVASRHAVRWQSLVAGAEVPSSTSPSLERR